MSVYNGAPYLRQAIDSILSQSFTDFEFIIVDDGSTDETASILETYTDSRIVKLRNASNAGLTYSLNRGLSVARGTYVARQDADDISWPNRFTRQLTFLESHPGVSVVGTAFEEFYSDGRSGVLRLMPVDHESIVDQLFYSHSFAHGSVMTRREALQAVGGYREEFNLAEDHDLWLRMAERYRLANLAEPLYRLRMSPNSITARWPAHNRRLARRAVAEALLRGILQPSAQALGRFYWHSALDALAARDREKARSLVQEAIRHNPNFDNDIDFLENITVVRFSDFAKEMSTLGGAPMAYRDVFTMLANLFSILPRNLLALHQRRHRMLGELHAAHAFVANGQRDRLGVLRHCLGAWSHDISQFRNLGLISIFLRSLFTS